MIQVVPGGTPDECGKLLGLLYPALAKGGNHSPKRLLDQFVRQRLVGSVGERKSAHTPLKHMDEFVFSFGVAGLNPVS